MLNFLFIADKSAVINRNKDYLSIAFQNQLFLFPNISIFRDLKL